MKKLLIGMGKGGTGKSTTTLNLACAAASHQQRVLVIDTDPRRSLLKWFISHDHYHVEVLGLAVTDVRQYLQNLALVAQRPDLILIDSQPAIAWEVVALANMVDEVLLPISASVFDMWNVQGTISELPQGCQLKLFFNLTSAKDPELPKIIAALSALPQNERFTILKTIWARRVIFKNSVAAGKSAVDYKGKARQEVLALAQELELIN